jgi:2-keto-4-pentenoate hydratase/2-oxohepta-3-ene-1,7-dioic acid hydratase in catechol pathway
MHLARFVADGTPRAGLVDGDRIHDLGDAGVLGQMIASGLGGTTPRKGATYPADELTLLAPISAAGRCLFATGWNYRRHFAEGAAARGADVDEPAFPTFFSKPATTVIGPYDPICIDGIVSEQFDYEAELAVVIGQPGRGIKAEDAMGHVFGYVAANDVSARDIQRRHGGQWFKGKSIDATCPLGPWIVTADELPDPGAMRIECIVNGEIRQQADTSTMAFSIPRLIEELSQGMTLLPGDVILTGTPAGVGSARQPPSWLVDGDEVITRISGIGELRNRVRQI